ncbi:MAG: transposase [Chitinophagaceae bacterium]|nr:transposase [Chitinophagaceae bacterium]MCW5927053.1 transposase [Chitinophagaceae bacterium]
MWGIIEGHKCKLYRINSMPDHIHIFSDMHSRGLFKRLC